MRARLAIIGGIVVLFFLTSYLLLPSTTSPSAASPPPLPEIHVSADILSGEAIMPKLGNETAKAELGRAAWKLLHTTLSRYPMKPSAGEREALRSYLYLFARLYPCGECAAHFRLLLQQYPPQTSSRDAAAQWGCYLHNLVNERLGKQQFDCASVSEVYKCGCADADAEEDAAAPLPEGAKEGAKEGGKAPEKLAGAGVLEENVRRAGDKVEIEVGP